MEPTAPKGWQTQGCQGQTTCCVKSLPVTSTPLSVPGHLPNLCSAGWSPWEIGQEPGCVIQPPCPDAACWPQSVSSAELQEEMRQQ